MKRPSQQIKREIIDKHFNKRISQVQLAKDYGLSTVTICHICKKFGDSPMDKNYTLNDKEIIKMYVEDRMSILRIATKLKITRRPIYLRLKRAGVLVREKKSEVVRQKLFDEIPHFRLKLQIWKANVFQRDGLKCRMCNSENSFENRLEAHHIIPVRDIVDSKMALDINNGITICRKCHMKIHYREYEFVDIFRNLISKPLGSE
jgi:predicted DNA-binding protein YlxM (UPF0122 family)